MQKMLVAAALAAGLGMCGTASAADLGSLKDGPMVLAPVGGWTGAYVGIGIGGGATSDNVNGTAANRLDIRGAEGVFGTVQVGYDRQYGRFVGGIFFDYDFTNISADTVWSTGNRRVTYNTGKIDLNNEWSVGGRAGFLVNPETLVYGLAAYTQADFSLPFGFSGSTRDGYTVGGGIETRLTGNWFVKGEYRYTHFSDETLSTKNFSVTDQTDVQSGRVVLSYKADLFGRDLIPLK